MFIRLIIIVKSALSILYEIIIYTLAGTWWVAVSVSYLAITSRISWNLKRKTAVSQYENSITMLRLDPYEQGTFCTVWFRYVTKALPK